MIATVEHENDQEWIAFHGAAPTLSEPNTASSLVGLETIFHAGKIVSRGTTEGEVWYSAEIYPKHALAQRQFRGHLFGLVESD